MRSCCGCCDGSLDNNVRTRRLGDIARAWRPLGRCVRPRIIQPAEANERAAERLCRRAPRVLQHHRPSATSPEAPASSTHSTLQLPHAHTGVDFSRDLHCYSRRAYFARPLVQNPVFWRLLPASERPIHSLSRSTTHSVSRLAPAGVSRVSFHKAALHARPLARQTSHPPKYVLASKLARSIQQVDRHHDPCPPREKGPIRLYASAKPATFMLATPRSTVLFQAQFTTQEQLS